MFLEEFEHSPTVNKEITQNLNTLVKLDFIVSVAEQYAAQAPTPTPPHLENLSAILYIRNNWVWSRACHKLFIMHVKWFLIKVFISLGTNLMIP